MMRIAIAPALGPALVLALTACAGYEEDTDFVSDAPEARVLGAAESCISPERIRSTVVHDDRTIDFVMGGGEIYRNTLPRRCPRLGFERSISYDVRGGRLCSPEIIYVLDNTGGRLDRGVGCGLGEFVPVEYVERAPGDAPAIMGE